MKYLFSIIVLMLAALAANAQDAKVKDTPKYGRGFKMPSAEVLKARHDAAFKRHGNRMRSLPKQTDATFDITTKGWASPIDDQGQCGSCWLVSAKVNTESAFIKAGFGTNWRFSSQYLMDCKSSDPCNGGDEADVFTLAKSDGMVTLTDYGVPYQQAPRQCKYTNQKKYTIANWGYCHSDQGAGIASVQEIKNAMVQYGMISVAVDATQFDSYNGGVLSGTGHSIDHAVNLVGWDDSKGAWKLQNQWGTSWGEGGFMWIKYGAFDVGTEAIWCSTGALPPVPPTPPIPPIPPTPGNDSVTLTINQGGKVMTLGPFPLTPAGSIVWPKDTPQWLKDAIINQTKKESSTTKEPPLSKPDLPPVIDIKREQGRIDDRLNQTDADIAALVGVVAKNTQAIATLQRVRLQEESAKLSIEMERLKAEAGPNLARLVIRKTD